jgi:hypothetical protein
MLGYLSILYDILAADMLRFFKRDLLANKYLLMLIINRYNVTLD